MGCSSAPCFFSNRERPTNGRAHSIDCRRTLVNESKRRWSREERYENCAAGERKPTSMTRSALKNPYAVVALSLIIIMLGVVSYQKMVVDIFPEINLPVVAVATFYKGMGPSEIEGAITLRLEQLYLQASYVDHIESRSLAGISLIKVYFHPECDVNAGVAELTSLTYSALRYLPKGVFPPTIIKFGASSLPIAQLT